MPRSSRGGVAVTPYGVRRVTTADGTLLYQHQDPEPRVLVAPWVAAQMTDLLQSVVANGTGRSAELGRPTAGKTGTTSSNKDAWFIGFSSGITTGVWMGRDDNRALPGLAGGRAPARAFHDFMMRAVANRPAEAFATEVTTPDWQMEGDNEIWFAPPEDEPFVDADGNPVEREPPAEERPREDAAPRDEEDVQLERLERELDERPFDRPRPPRRPPPPPRERGDTYRPDGQSAAEAVEGGALALQPCPRRLRVGAEQAFDQRVEIGAVVEVDEVGDLVRDRRAADMVRGEDQPPAVADRARGRAASPARNRIADADP